MSPKSCCGLSGAGLLFIGCMGLAGCSGLVPAPVAAAVIAVTGNWQVASSAPVAAQLPSLSGELSGSSVSMTGILHSNSSTSCLAPTQAIAMSGSANAKGVVTLTGGDVAGGTLTISGTLAADGKSMTDASYQVKGGSCAFASPADASAESYSSIDGNYSGNFVDGSGGTLAVTATLSHSADADQMGDFELSGTGTFPSNPCFNSPVSISNSQVTGGSFNLTYSDASTGNSVSGSGTFSTDGKTLTVTQWTLTGPCGPDNGTGLLSQ